MISTLSTLSWHLETASFSFYWVITSSLSSTSVIVVAFIAVVKFMYMLYTVENMSPITEKGNQIVSLRNWWRERKERGKEEKKKWKQRKKIIFCLTFLLAINFKGGHVLWDENRRIELRTFIKIVCLQFLQAS